MTTPVYEMIQINRLVEITLVLITVIIFTRSIQTLYKKISLRRFYRKILMVTPIETKQETVWPRFEGGSSGEKNAWCWTDPIHLMKNWTRLIQLAIGRVGCRLTCPLAGRTSLVWLLRCSGILCPYFYFLFRKCFRELFDIDFVVTYFDPNSYPPNT